MRSLCAALCVGLALLLGGCVTVAPPGTGPQSFPPGRYHKVESGETLWRVSRIYGIELQELLDANSLTDSAKISAGQMLRIPGDRAPVPQPPAPVTGVRVPDDEEFVWPLRGRVLASFGDPLQGIACKGITIAPGSRDLVVASRSGTVVFCSDDFRDYGKTVIIEHPGGFWTVYCRNAELYVKTGDTVQRGSPIGRVGRAGRDPAAYLYFEIRKGHVTQNPNFYLPR